MDAEFELYRIKILDYLKKIYTDGERKIDCLKLSQETKIPIPFIDIILDDLIKEGLLKEEE